MSATKSSNLTNLQMTVYALPALPAALVLVTVGIYLPNFYTDNLAVTAGMLSWVFLIGRFWDALTDPLMGYLSDKTKSRWGRRRPYLLLAALPLWIAFYLIWSPDPTLSPTSQFVYLLICYLVLYTFWTVFNVPYQSLGMELTPDYNQRNTLFGIRQILSVIGTIGGMMVPIYLVTRMGDRNAAYSAFSLYAGGLIAVILIFTFFRLKERSDLQHGESFPFFEGMKITFRNRAFVIVVLTYLTSLIGASFIAPLAMYMAKYVIKAEWAVQYTVLAYMLGSIIAIPFWIRLAARTNKIRAWQVAMVSGGLFYFGALLYDEGTWILWIIFAFLVGTTSGCTTALGPSVIADVIDQDELETGKRREGAFVGIQSFIDKAAVGIAIFIGLQGLEYVGYEPNVEQPAIVIGGLIFLYGVLPGILQITAAFIINRFPITPEVHADIRRQLGR